MTQPTIEEVTERETMRLAGISTAAFGYWKVGDSIHPDYDTQALRDVADLYAKYDKLHKELAAIKSQPVPVEPDVVKRMRIDGQSDTLLSVIDYIDALLSQLQVAQQELSTRTESLAEVNRLLSLNVAEVYRLSTELRAWNLTKTGLATLLEQAEARNKRLVELLKSAGVSINFLCELVRDNSVRLQYRKQTAKIDELLRDVDK